MKSDLLKGPKSDTQYQKLVFLTDGGMGDIYTGDSSSFWVTDLQHQFDDSGHTINVGLESGIRNKYRELLIDRALFFERLGFMDVYQKNEFEIDDKLKAIYKY